MNALEDLCIRATRHPRHLYRYLTGDASCLGFVRVALALSASCWLAWVVVLVRDNRLSVAGAELASWTMFMIWSAPRMFTTAALCDSLPDGPALPFPAAFRWVRLAASLLVLPWIVFDALTGLTVQGVLTDIYAAMYLTAMWQVTDREGGKGERTLAKDLRGLMARRGPGMAGEHSLAVIPVRRRS